MDENFTGEKSKDTEIMEPAIKDLKKVFFVPTLDDEMLKRMFPFLAVKEGVSHKELIDSLEKEKKKTEPNEKEPEKKALEDDLVDYYDMDRDFFKMPKRVIKITEDCSKLQKNIRDHIFSTLNSNQAEYGLFNLHKLEKLFKSTRSRIKADLKVLQNLNVIHFFEHKSGRVIFLKTVKNKKIIQEIIDDGGVINVELRPTFGNNKWGTKCTPPQSTKRTPVESTECPPEQSTKCTPQKEVKSTENKGNTDNSKDHLKNHQESSKILDDPDHDMTPVKNPLADLSGDEKLKFITEKLISWKSNVHEINFLISEYSSDEIFNQINHVMDTARVKAEAGDKMSSPLAYLKKVLTNNKIKANQILKKAQAQAKKDSKKDKSNKEPEQLKYLPLFRLLNVFANETTIVHNWHSTLNKFAERLIKACDESCPDQEFINKIQELPTVTTSADMERLLLNAGQMSSEVNRVLAFIGERLRK